MVLILRKDTLLRFSVMSTCAILLAFSPFIFKLAFPFSALAVIVSFLLAGILMIESGIPDHYARLSLVLKAFAFMIIAGIVKEKKITIEFWDMYTLSYSIAVVGMIILAFYFRKHSKV